MARFTWARAPRSPRARGLSSAATWGPLVHLTVLLPTLNEAEGIVSTLRRLPRDALQAAHFDVDVWIVDGASTDGTAERAQALGAHVIVEQRRGYGRAYKTALARVPGDVVVTADADDTYPLDQLPQLLSTFFERGLDFATINRFAKLESGSMSATNRFGNAVLSLAARMLFGVRLRDSQSGMWILNRRALERLPLESLSDGMPFSQDLKLAAFGHPHLRAAELPGRYRPRVGEAKLLRWSDGTRNLRGLLRRRRSGFGSR